MDTLNARGRRDETHAMRWDAACRVSIRPIDRSDAGGLSDLYLSLTPESRRSRFLGSVGDGPLHVRALRLAAERGFVAVLDESGPQDGSLVGHIALLPAGKGTAEVAVVVADACQGKGIGTRLVHAAGEEARRLGLRHIVASTFADNVRMRRLLLHSGWPVENDAVDACVEEIELAVA
jgi:acetyltransferase